MKVALNDFDAVSVREADTIQLLDEVTPVTVSLVVDPTLLLSHSEWEEVCDERLIQEPYMFCYFLGKNEKSRELCHEYAKTHHIKIVNIPMVNNGYYFHDKHQSDMMMYNASPEEFLSLIKYAEIVFTDSFHATVLSHIFQKQYVIFKRDKKDDMSSRIYDVTRVFGTEERYCCNEMLETLEYIENMRDIEYKENPILEEFISRSKEFLVRNLHE